MLLNVYISLEKPGASVERTPKTQPPISIPPNTFHKIFLISPVFCLSAMWIFSTLKHLLLKGLLRSIAHFDKKLPRLVHKQDIYVLLLLMIVDESGGRQVS